MAKQKERTCEDCIHYEVCCLWSTTDLIKDRAHESCYGRFKSADDFISREKHESHLKECENGYAATLHLERSRIANQREEINRLHKHIRSLEQSRGAWRDKAERLGKQLHETLYGRNE